jgi:hypothetical protein
MASIIKLIKILSLLVVILSIFLVGSYYYIFAVKPFSETPFNRGIWFSAVGKTDSEQFKYDRECARGAMYADLKKNHLKPEMSKDDVKTLLGKPESENPYCLSYNLGMCSGFKMDYDSLYICFENQRIDKVYNSPY